MKKSIIVVISLIMLLIPTVSVKAETLQDMYNKLSTLQNKLNNANNSKKLTQNELKT